MESRGIMEILPGVPFYISITNLLATPVFLPKHMKVTPGSKALPHVIYARSAEPSTKHNPKFDSTTHTNGDLGENKKYFHQGEGKPITPQNRNADSIVNEIQPPVGSQDQRKKQPQPMKAQSMENNDW